MTVNQIYSLMNDIMVQHFGGDDVDQLDLTGLISMGSTVLSDSGNTDIFLNALVDRIGKTVVRTLDLELDFPNLLMDSFEFGAILQKITVNPFSAIQNDSYEIGADNFESAFAEVAKASIFTRYFEKGADTWRFKTTIPDDLLSTAFTSAEMMGNFIDAIVSSMTDTLTISLNAMARTAIVNFIAEKVKAQNGVINLLTLYNTAYPNDSTVDDYESFMESPTALRFAGKIMRNTIRYMSKPSVLYNAGDGVNSVVRATARDNMHVFLLTDFISSYVTNYQSDSFNEEMVQLPLYQEVEFWQGTGDGLLEADSMNQINVVPASDTKQGQGGTAVPVNQTGIIGFFADRQAIGIGLNKMRAGTFRNDIDHYTNVSRDALQQWYNDLSENAVVFIVEETE